MACRRVAVLISGNGSNLQALIAAVPETRAEIALVVSDRPAAFGLERARAAGIPTRILDEGHFADRAAFEAELDTGLRTAGVELVCLAGFMRILSPGFVAAWHDRLLNIHPSLLPAFRGLRTHERVLAARLPVHGCTVHLVRPELDAGPVLVQGIAPVLPEDTPESLAVRVLELEHLCYPRALSIAVSGRLRVEGEAVSVAGERAGERLLLHPRLRG